MTCTSSWPLTSRATTTCYNGRYKEKRPRESGETQKSVVVRIESATRLHAVGTASTEDISATVNTFLGLYHTARHHHMGVGWKRSQVALTFGEGAYHFVIRDDRGEVVTR